MHRDARELTKVHTVIPDRAGKPYDCHTHGLQGLGHPEFQVLAPGYCLRAVVELLLGHANRVANLRETYRTGERIMLDGVRCGYEEVQGDLEGDQPRLRIVDLPNGCECQVCKDRRAVQEQ